MSLAPGSRLGVYEVVAPLGVGGMGEVYRATDTKLGRQVALKVLPTSVAQDVERLARFDREARTLALLNHPHIAQIYGLEDSGGVKALVMELVEGPTLADRLAQGAIPTEEALAIAGQMAEALEAAHEQGIIHRDLKPANVKVRPDGTVKVLDFGLAKAMESGAAAAGPGLIGLSQSPTITSPAMTQLGMILGTAAYMAPEQASGKPVDKRADIWAFGVVLWEMLTGRRMFEGETISHVLAAVLTREPDLSAVPLRVRPLLSRCLEKDARKRLRDIGDAMSLVPAAGESTTGAPGHAPAVAPSRRWVAAGGWAAAGLLAAALVTLAWTRTADAPEGDQPAVRFQIERAGDVYNRTASGFAVSPDGGRIAYYKVGEGGGTTLIVQTLATGDVRELRSLGDTVPQRDSFFWSPDSRQLVTGTGTGAQMFDLALGSARALCECRYTGGAWSRDGTILLGAFGTGPGSEGISRVSSTSSGRKPVTTVDASRGERDTFPLFLPDGRRFLFTRSSTDGVATYVGSLDGGPVTRVADGSQRVFIPGAAGRGAYLLGIDATGLVAQPFDPETIRVTGAPRIIVAGAAAVSASENGVLATSAEGDRPRTIPTWFDRKGSARGTIGEAASIDAIALSSDGRMLAVSENQPGARAAGSQVWLQDLASGARTRLTFNRGSTPVWSPDGRRLAYTSARNGVNLPYQKAADGSGDERPLFAYDFHAWTNDWSRDGRWIIFSSPPRQNAVGNDLWAIRMDGGGDGKPVPYLKTPALEQQAQFSPDGRFIAYGSDQSGAWEIYVQPFPNASDGKWMVSRGGGVEPRWSRDGKELFYFSAQTLMAAPVRLEPTFSSGTPTALFEAPIVPGYTADSHRWLLAPDGQRVLVLATAGKGQGTPLDVIVNCKMTAGCR